MFPCVQRRSYVTQPVLLFISQAKLYYYIRMTDIMQIEI